MGVNVPAKIPKTDGGKFLFSSQDAYEKAIEERTQAQNADIPELQALLSGDNVVIQAGEGGDPTPAPTVDPQPSAEPSPTPAPGNGDGTATNVPKALVDRLKEAAEKAGLKFEYTNDDQLIDALIHKENRIKYLSSENKNLANSSTAAPSPGTEVEDLKKKVVELEAKTSAPTATPGPAVSVGESKKAEIDQLTAEIDTITDPLSDEAAQKQRKLNKLVVYEMGRLEKLKSSAPSNQGEMDAMKAKLNDLEKTTSQNRSSDLERQATEQKNIEKHMIDDFQGKHEDYRMGRNIYDVDVDYRRFADELFQLKNGRPTSNIKEKQDIINAYFGHDIALQQSAKNAGIEKPAEIEKYMDVCSLLQIREQLNTGMGKEHSLEDALLYKMANDGTITDAMLAQRKIGAEAIKNSSQNRSTNYAEQLTNNSGASPEETGDAMTEKQALEHINSISPVDAKRDPKKREILVNAYRKMNIDATDI